MAEDKGTFAAFQANVSGRVQGVGFRYLCREQARRLGLFGWVRNLPNGDVEVRAEGDCKKLEDMLKWLKRGPPGAWVNSVHHDKHDFSGKYRSFEIR